MNTAVENTGGGARTFPPVTIYTASDCHWCGKAKQYLARRGVPFTEIDVEADEAAARDVIARTGQRGVPVIAIGADLIVGFQRRQLDALLALGAPDTAVEATLPPAQDTTAEAVAARRLTLTPDQQATVTYFAQLVDARALCDYLARQLDYTPTTCDHTFRYTTVFLTAHSSTGADPGLLLTLLRTIGIECDCGYAINACMR
jgi:glutaredoxin-like YruB-family protein